ncbi:MAG TPA: sigma-70 family RNA polymerase sigma factor [Vicinamibacterales bacterium]|nr:sigma-70 family RNA polymerase sigma factor [Vicinamibacterales bacterium]
MAATGPDLASLIARARDQTASVADRHEAFGELVRRFQDAAIASAYARLRDRALAEDAAQDAFLTAWERLDQLRQPDAFPGWILRLVFTQCHRRLRCARLPIVPEEDARPFAGEQRSAEVEATLDRRILQRALSGLTPSNRLVLSLFYGSERSQREIADWLGVPVTTVARRLAHAKRRLQKAAFELLSGTLRAERKLAGDTFVIELSARLRRADRSDAIDITSLAARLEIERAHRVCVSTPVCAYVVEDPGTHAPIAYAAAAQTIFEPMYELQLAIGDDAIRRHAGDALLMQVLEDLQAKKAIAVRYHTSARQATLVAFLLSRGFEIVRRAQDWRLGNATCAALPAVNPDWEFRSFEMLGEDSALFDQALRLVASAVEDDPAARAFLPIHPDTFRRALRAQACGVIALSGGIVRGLIGGSADDTVSNGCRIALLTVARHSRRQGIATALLHRLLVRRGVVSARLTAPGRPDLMGWLARCGFVHVTDALLVERLLRKSVRIAPERLDEYVGRYVAEAPGMEPVVVERFGNSLVSKSRDMRDVLLAVSDREFFTRHHYGEGRFERDESGRVARLAIREGAHEFVAVRSHPR